jgi:hypothetical protein
MKNLFFVLPVVALALVFAGCSKKNNGPSTTASVMLVNGCNGTTGIYAKVNNANVGPSNIAYFGNSGYLTMTAGTAQAINFYLVSPAGTPLTAGLPTFTAGDHYSVFVGGIVTGPDFVVTTDDLTAPSSGNAKVRFINLGSDNLNESFSIGATTLDSNITYGQCTAFAEIAATSSVGVLVQDPAHGQPAYLAQLTSQAFSAGKIYTVMLSGTYSGTGATALKLTVIGNN